MFFTTIYNTYNYQHCLVQWLYLPSCLQRWGSCFWFPFQYRQLMMTFFLSLIKARALCWRMQIELAGTFASMATLLFKRNSYWLTFKNIFYCRVVVICIAGFSRYHDINFIPSTPIFFSSHLCKLIKIHPITIEHSMINQQRISMIIQWLTT